MKRPKVAVVVLTYAGPEIVRETLTAVTALDYPRHDVFVVDNGSSAGAGSSLRKEYSNVEVLESEVNLGVAGGFNLGLRRVLSGSWKYALLLHHDVEPEPSMLRELVTAAEANPMAAAVGPRIHDFWDRRKIQSAGGALRPRAKAIRWRGRGEVDRGQFDEDLDVEVVSGAAILVRMDVVRTIGPFDPQFWFYENADWCLRATAAGRTVRYCGRAAAWRMTASRRPDRARRERRVGRSAALLVRRHGTSAARAGFVALALVQLLPAAMERLFRGRHSPLARLRGALDGSFVGLNDPPKSR